MRVHLFQVREDLLILAVVVIADAVTLVDNQQRKLAAKQIQVAGDRLHAAKDNLTVALFTLEPGGENIGLQPQRAILGVVLRDQLFDVRQHQHAATRQAGQLGNDQAFACAGREDNRCRFPVFAKPGEGGVNGFLLIGTKCKSHGVSVSLIRI